MDSALIDAMATAMRERPSELGDAYARELAAFMLGELAQRHPGIAALLRGEAVAVPKEPTEEMVNAGIAALSDHVCEHGEGLRMLPTAIESIHRALLAASPFAKEGKE